jgi:hypothetical protein
MGRRGNKVKAAALLGCRRHRGRAGSDVLNVFAGFAANKDFATVANGAALLLGFSIIAQA